MKTINNNVNGTVVNVDVIEDDFATEEEIAMWEKMNNATITNLNMELPDTDVAAGIIDKMLRNNKNGIFIGNTWSINYKGYEIIPVTDSYQATWLPDEVTLGMLLLDDAGYPVSFEPEAYQWEEENNIPVLDRDVYKDEEVYGQMVACRKLASN